MDLQEEVVRLRAAIIEHRSQKADDRCIEDDDRLYAVLGDGIKCDRRVGSKVEMLKNCERFINNRCENGQWKTYQDLEAENIKLRKIIDKNNYGYDLPPNDSRMEKYAKQREERGFDDTETVDLDATIARFLIPRLEAFKETADCNPANLSSLEEWHDIIQKIIDAFKETIAGQDTWSRANFQYDANKVKEGLMLFAKYFEDLWR